MENEGFDFIEMPERPLVENPKDVLRAKIYKQLGIDPESLLGTTADGAALALFGLSTLIAILNEHGSANVKTALNETQGGQLVSLAQSFLVSIETGDIKLPALEKGLENVVKDIGERSTGVAMVLNNS